MEQDKAIKVRDVFAGPVQYFEHPEIGCEDKAKEKMSGDLCLPGSGVEKVTVKFSNMAFNVKLKKSLPIYETYDTDGSFIGHYFSCAFSSLSASQA